jgi:hypothetical protein
MATLRRYTMTTKKFPISALPLAAKKDLLIHQLTPDTHTPDIPAFRRVQVEFPSLQRRARVCLIFPDFLSEPTADFLQLLAPPCHFSYVAPFPVRFPYDIDPPVPAQDADKTNYIEKWLAEREAVHPQPPSALLSDAPLVKHASKHRDQPLDLIGISETGLRDCVPNLDVGDAFTMLGTPTLTQEFDDEGHPQPSQVQEAVAARQELIDVLSGQYVLMSPADDGDKTPFAPWSMRYSGHQFGSWAGQLGDGRAISVRM